MSSLSKFPTARRLLPFLSGLAFMAGASAALAEKTKVLTGADGQVLEISTLKEGDSRPIRKTVFHPKYGEAATYEADYLSVATTDQRLRELRIYPVSEMKEGPLVTYGIDGDSDPSIYSTKPPVAMIIDSGFFPSHPRLHGKHYRDPQTGRTTIRGTQTAGAQVEIAWGENENLLMPLADRGAPYTHGTGVASVAMKQISHGSFIGAHGNYHAAPFLYQLMELIGQYDIRFTNMSFGLGDKNSPALENSDREALGAFIQTQARVLHVIASGNQGLNFDQVKYSEYPACYRSLQSVVVSGLSTGVLEESKLSTYERSKMANHGTRCVDILAPAEGVMVAWLWPLEVKAGGTSVASPYVLNILLKMHEIHGDLDSREFRELLLKTAYVPADQRFSVRSGGIVHERRALRATQIYRAGGSIDQAVLQSRQEIHDSFELNEMTDLQELWRKNKLRF